MQQLLQELGVRSRWQPHFCVLFDQRTAARIGWPDDAPIPRLGLRGPTMERAKKAGWQVVGELRAASLRDLNGRESRRHPRRAAQCVRLRRQPSNRPRTWSGLSAKCVAAGDRHDCVNDLTAKVFEVERLRPFPKPAVSVFGFCARLDFHLPGRGLFLQLALDRYGSSSATHLSTTMGSSSA